MWGWLIFTAFGLWSCPPISLVWSAPASGGRGVPIGPLNHGRPPASFLLPIIFVIIIADHDCTSTSWVALTKVGNMAPIMGQGRVTPTRCVTHLKVGTQTRCMAPKKLGHVAPKLGNAPPNHCNMGSQVCFVWIPHPKNRNEGVAYQSFRKSSSK